MTAVSTLCRRAILLKGGSVALEGAASDVVSEYLAAVEGEPSEVCWTDLSRAPGDDVVRIVAIRAFNDSGGKPPFAIDEPLHLEVDYENLQEGARVYVAFRVRDPAGSYVLTSVNAPELSLGEDPFYCAPLAKGVHRSRCTLPPNFLNDIRYTLHVIIATPPPPRILAQVKDAISFSIFDTGDMRPPGLSGRWYGTVRMKLPWTTTGPDGLGGGGAT